MRSIAIILAALILGFSIYTSTTNSPAPEFNPEINICVVSSPMPQVSNSWKAEVKDNVFVINCKPIDDSNKTPLIYTSDGEVHVTSP